VKKILVIAILAGAGLWYYKNVYALPIYGEWAPNEKEFMHRAYEKSAMTPEQEAHVKSYVSSTRVIIDRSGETEFRFPDQKGKFPHKITHTTGNCYLLDLPIGSFESCVDGRSMKMKSIKTGYVETYEKI
jgi:hypothetical protein